MVDTSREAMERVARFLEIGPSRLGAESESAAKVRRINYERESSSMLRALLSERDELRARAEKAEAERGVQIAGHNRTATDCTRHLLERDKARKELETVSAINAAAGLEIRVLRATVAAQAARIEEARRVMDTLYAGYVCTYERGRDAIIELGGKCDTVDVMVKADPALVKARAWLEKEGE